MKKLAILLRNILARFADDDDDDYYYFYIEDDDDGATNGDDDANNTNQQVVATASLAETALWFFISKSDEVQEQVFQQLLDPGRRQLLDTLPVTALFEYLVDLRNQVINLGSGIQNSNNNNTNNQWRVFASTNRIIIKPF